jgi:hypothetical protein
VAYIKISHKSPKKVTISDFFGSIFFHVFLYKIKLLIYCRTFFNLCLALRILLSNRKVIKKVGQTHSWTSYILVGCMPCPGKFLPPSPNLSSHLEYTRKILENDSRIFFSVNLGRRRETIPAISYGCGCDRLRPVILEGPHSPIQF